MPTRKQRRRREKNFRHEFGFVEYDEEGNEVELDPAELRKEKATPAKAKAKPQQRGRANRPVREVPPPSWRRSFKRGGLMGGLMLIIMIGFLGSAAAIGIIYAAAFIPFTYWVDRIAYRNYLRRSGKA
jgi:predicted lipid-binding transport protein (Tim44 family)